MPEESSAPTRRWLPAHTAAAAFFVVIVAMLAAYAHAGDDVRFGWTIMVLPTIAGALAGSFHLFEWYAWLDGFLFGAVSGAIAIVDIVRHPAFDDSFFIAMMTMSFFLALFFFLGGVAELVRYFHRLLHRKKKSEV